MKLHTERITENSPFLAQLDRLMREAFPPEEALPPATLLQMARADGFDLLALLDGAEFVGFLAVYTHGRLAYLFFLAVAPEQRGKGYGGRAIEALRARYPEKKQVVDLEMPDATAENAAQRRRRKQFYLRQGYRETGLFLSYFGVDYEVLCMGDGFCAAEFQEMLKNLPLEGFAPRYFVK